MNENEQTTPEAGAAPPPTAVGLTNHELARESAAYRTQRNAALRRAHAYETMLKAHGIDTSGVTDERLAAMPIAHGAVDGPFAYEAPTLAAVPEAQAPRAAVGDGETTPTALTRNDLEGMSADEINERWAEVQSALRGA